MRWSELLAALEADELVAGDDFAVKTVAAADLLSDILATGYDDFIIFTGQTSRPAILTALAAGAKGVVMLRGKDVPQETVELASSYGVPLATTRYLMFDACCRAGELLWSSRLSRSSSTD